MNFMDMSGAMTRLFDFSHDHIQLMVVLTLVVVLALRMGSIHLKWQGYERTLVRETEAELIKVSGAPPTP